jgi:hypothetical protein
MLHELAVTAFSDHTENSFINILILSNSGSDCGTPAATSRMYNLVCGIQIAPDMIVTPAANYYLFSVTITKHKKQ